MTSASLISSARPREPVAAVRPALALDEPAVAQLEQDVLEELERDVLRLGDPLALGRPLARSRELERRAQRVVHLCGDPHVRILTPARDGGTIERPSTTGGRHARAQSGDRERPVAEEPEEVCDLVMKGGVASGVVYPGAILALAKRYRFRNVGGTSAGAIAATVTAAAELGRREGKNGGFERLREVADAIGEPNLVLGLFQPRPENRSFFELAVRMMEARAKGAGAMRRVITYSLRALWLPIALLALALDGGRLHRGLRALPLARLVVGAHLAGAGRLSRRRCRLPRRLRRGSDRVAAEPCARADSRRPQRGLRPLPGHRTGRLRPARAHRLAPRAHPGMRRPQRGRPAAHLRRPEGRRGRRPLRLSAADDDRRQLRAPGAPTAPRGQRLLLRPGRDREADSRPRRDLDARPSHRARWRSTAGRSTRSRGGDARPPRDTDEPRRPGPHRLGAVLRAAP